MGRPLGSDSTTPPQWRMDPKAYFVYLLASARDGVLYAGSTSRLIARIHEHKTWAVPGFTQRFRVNQLVWFEMHGDARSMVERERRIKEWPRAWKVRLIEENNPRWVDLYGELLGGPVLR